jgi:hypothetical protein
MNEDAEVTMTTLETLAATADRLSRRLNVLEEQKRNSPPFDRTPRLPPKSPEQVFQGREAAAGRLTEVFETDVTGRRISRFYGDPERVWGAFKLPARHVVNIKVPK